MRIGWFENCLGHLLARSMPPPDVTKKARRTPRALVHNPTMEVIPWTNQPQAVALSRINRSAVGWMCDLPTVRM